MYKAQKIRRSCLSLLIGLLALSFSGIGLAEPKRADEEYFDPPSEGSEDEFSWAFAIDNDILLPGPRDQDYTYGFNLTLVGKSTENQLVSLHRSLDWINSAIGLNEQLDSGIKASKVEYGLFGFTPEDISRKDPQQNDRPYASLVYVSSAREGYDPAQEVSWQSTLSLGVMGLSIVGDIQDAVHTGFNGNLPQGWDNQISDGGELTARYSVSRQTLRYSDDSGVELKTTLQGSIGYITEASWSLSSRAGKIHTPWVSFNPELTNYGEKSIPNTRVKVSEQYAWAGISLKLRAYNAFLQGQFKESAVTYDSGQLNHAIVEAWIGYTLAFTDGYSFTYSIRGHSSELKSGNGDRSVIWGGVLLSKTIG